MKMRTSFVALLACGALVPASAAAASDDTSARSRSAITSQDANSVGSSASASSGPGGSVTRSQNSVTGKGATVNTITSATADRGAGAVTSDSASSSRDQAILDSVVTALTSDPALEGAHLTVAVDRGEVRLTGAAKSESQAVRARSVAASVAGPERLSVSITPTG